MFQTFIMSLVANPVSLLTNIAAIFFVFGLIIFVHEFGHFIVAKRMGVKVEQFSFGFGKEIFGFEWGETRYTVNWIPLGGFVRMSGETPDDYEGPKFEGASTADPQRDRSRDFMAQAWYKRIGVALAGPVMNYILAAVLFFSMLMIWGEPFQINSTEIGVVIAGTPAEKAGLKVGDIIVSVNGQRTDEFLSVKLAIQDRPDQPTDLIVKRGETEIKFTMTPKRDLNQGNVGIIGIRPADPIVNHKPIGVVEAVKSSLNKCWNVTHFTLAYLGQKIVSREKPDVAGPVGITQVIVKAVKAGWEDFLFLIAMISLAIGLFNLFPVPMLDGSHVVYYSLEAIRKKPLSAKTMNRINVVGFALLMALMVFATVNDVQRIASDHAKTIESSKK